MKAEVKGLYAVTPDIADTAELLARAGAALAGGAKLLQYRNKTAGAALRLVQARALLALCREHHVPLIINDHLELALALDAHGLHLGGENGSVAAARERLGSGKILGVSCYGRIENAHAAVDAGATYVAFGGFFPSKVKPGSARTPVELLGVAKRELKLPVVAIGGITLDNAPQLLAAGADGVAVITALFEAPDVKLAAQRFKALFDAQS
ncbi:MAG: thiamine phosphate synthase [Betaproteobacteria bacterium]|nr:thiamine phosphate synthase [Betaproteobacteria bacterium]